MNDLEIDARSPEDGVVVLELRGFIDTNTAAALERALTEHGAMASRMVVMDLGSVDYVSSAGWGVMISTVGFLRDRGSDLRLASMRPEVSQVYELLEFPSILYAYDSVPDAVSGKSPRR